MARKPETVFRARVLPKLKELPNTAIFPIQQKTIVGDPDYILCIRGLFVALELKSEEGKLSPLQKHKLEGIVKAGGMAVVSYPCEWPIVYSRLLLLAKGEEK